jgi:predicted RNA binding protein YcfA (HicA-like mRNA interferase family)
MSKLKALSGREVVKLLKGFGFDLAGQRGSHMKLVRVVEGCRQVLTVPNHEDIDKGTLKAIIRQASRYIPEEELRESFYSPD